MKPKKCKECKSVFTPQRPLQAMCSPTCAYKRAKRKPIKKESKKRSIDNKAYLTLREVFLKGKICPVTGQRATQIHHKKGRIGSLLCDVKYWLAVSDEGHKKIELNPKWAKEQGYSLSRLA